MGVVMFYHLTGSALEDTVSGLLTRSLGAGWRVMLRGTDAARLDWLDARLWVLSADSFLPHGRAGGALDADQPVLLGEGAIGNGAQALMLIDGAETDPAEAQAMERIWILFDGQNEDAVIHARGQWKALTAAGLAAQYWSDADGRWEKKAG